MQLGTVLQKNQMRDAAASVWHGLFISFLNTILLLDTGSALGVYTDRKGEAEKGTLPLTG